MKTTIFLAAATLSVASMIGLSAPTAAAPSPTVVTLNGSNACTDSSYTDAVYWDENDNGEFNGGDERADGCWQPDVKTNNDKVEFELEDTGELFSYTVKDENGNSVEQIFAEADVGNFGPIITSGVGSTSGTWGFTQALIDYLAGRNFLLSIKSGSGGGGGNNTSKVAVWLFVGTSNPYKGGWSVPWNQAISNLAVYVGTDQPPEPPQDVPVPATGLLFALGALVFPAVRRRGRRQTA